MDNEKCPCDTSVGHCKFQEAHPYRCTDLTVLLMAFGISWIPAIILNCVFGYHEWFEIGIIWGLWHAELTVVGHNFGTEYEGYPYLGILAMCISCKFLGMGLMWLTKKTGSIYPAAIMHAANNFGGKGIGQLFISGIPEDYSPAITDNLIISIPSFMLCLVFLILMLRDNK